MSHYEKNSLKESPRNYYRGRFCIPRMYWRFIYLSLTLILKLLCLLLSEKTEAR